jgi:hypothetical protein
MARNWRLLALTPGNNSPQLKHRRRRIAPISRLIAMPHFVLMGR